MRFGPKPGDGFLPVFSVDTEDEAKLLLTLACHRDRVNGEWIAEELQAEQTLENLGAFGERLAGIYEGMKKGPKGGREDDPSSA